MHRLTKRNTIGNADTIKYLIDDRVPVIKMLEKLGRHEDLEEAGKLKEFPCAIGDPIYEVIKDGFTKEVFLSVYKVEDISHFQVKYAGCWIDRSYEGTELFYNKEEARKARDKMMDKTANSIKDIDLSSLRLPMAAVHVDPPDYPNKAVARIFDVDKPTNTILEEIQRDFRENTNMVFVTKGTEDVKV